MRHFRRASNLLAQTPLRWIVKKASHHGLTFRNDVDIDGDAVTAAITDSYKDFTYGVYSKFSKPMFRKIGEDPDVREDGTHTNVKMRPSINRYLNDGVPCPLIGHQISRNGRPARRSIRAS